MNQLYYPLISLREGEWFKLICGASYQNLPAVRNLVLVYTLAGADCIDVAADPAVVTVAQEALAVADCLGKEAQVRGFELYSRPWLMVSLSDGEDPHFRKAELDPALCPDECSRPCEKICPAQAIAFQNTKDGAYGVIESSCYGCGRCLPVCPSQLIETRSYISTPEAVASLMLPNRVDALEIHTQVGHFGDFKRLWRAIAPWVNQLKLLAISCPDDEGLIDYLSALYDLITPLPCSLVWQTDGRPMSGDIGAGTTRAAVKLAQKVIEAGLPGYVQPAGGTNNHTVDKLKATGLLKKRTGENTQSLVTSPQPSVAGVAYGSYARVLLSPILDKLERFYWEEWQELDANLASSASPLPRKLEDFPDLLWPAVAKAHSLVSQLKPTHKSPKALSK